MRRVRLPIIATVYYNFWQAKLMCKATLKQLSFFRSQNKCLTRSRCTKLNLELFDSSLSNNHCTLTFLVRCLAFAFGIHALRPAGL